MLQQLAAELGRTPNAIRVRAHALGHRKIVDNYKHLVCLTQLVKQTGYGPDRIRTVIHRLGIHVMHKGNRQVVVPGAVPKIIAELKATGHINHLRRSFHGQWGVLGGHRVIAPACVDCGTAERPHYAKDRCLRCYCAHQREVRKGRSK